MQWSSWSKHVFERDDSHAISCAISHQEKCGLHKCITRFITYSSSRRADTWFPSLLRKECTGVRYVITKFSRMDCLPNFLTHGAPLARFARRSPAIKLLKLLVRIEAIKMTKTGGFKAHPQSQASKKWCHIQTLGTCHQIEWNIKITGQAYRRLNGLQFWFLQTC